jgi:hypothetical protein
MRVLLLYAVMVLALPRKRTHPATTTTSPAATSAAAVPIAAPKSRNAGRHGAALR